MPITPEQALHLYRQINKGPAIGADSEDNVIHEDTGLGNCLQIMGYPTYISRNHHDPKFAERGRKDGSVYNVAQQVAFLREWADALEKLWVAP